MRVAHVLSRYGKGVAGMRVASSAEHTSDTLGAKESLSVDRILDKFDVHLLRHAMVGWRLVLPGALTLVLPSLCGRISQSKLQVATRQQVASRQAGGKQELSSCKQ